MPFLDYSENNTVQKTTPTERNNRKRLSRQHQARHRTRSMSNDDTKYSLVAFHQEHSCDNLNIQM